MFGPEFRWDVVIEIAALVSTAAGVYAAIRSDLKMLMAEHANIKGRVDRVENRLDTHLDNHKGQHA